MIKGRDYINFKRSLRKPLVFVISALLILGTFLSTFGFVPSVKIAHAAGNTYYVDATGGLDTNTGTDDTHPWKTLTKVKAAMTAATIHAGDSVLFKRGETFAGNLVINVTGTAGNILTFADYGTGTKPIINAAGLLHGIDIRTNKAYISVSNLSVTGATQDGLFLYSSVSNLIIDGVDVVGTPNAINATTGTFANITISGSTITSPSSDGIRFKSFTSLTNILITNTVVTNSTEYGVYVNNDTAGTCSGPTISNSQINQSHNRGIYVVNCNNAVVNNNTTVSSGGSYGINIAGTSDNIQISNTTANSNTSSGLVFGGTSVTNSIVSHSIFNLNGGNGVAISNGGNNIELSDVTASSNDGDGFNVHNTVTNVNIIGYTADSNGKVGVAGAGDGYSYHETTSGIIRNSIARNNMKSAVAHVGSASVDMYNNLFYHTTNGTIGLVYLEGDGTYSLYNNTIYSSANIGSGLQISLPTGPTVMAKNNIIYGFDKGIEKEVGTVGTVTEDYNIVYGANTPYSGLSAGAHDIQLDPKLVNPATNFNLQSSSPAIDAGVDLNINTDYAGKQRYDMPGVVNTGSVGAFSKNYVDIGAYEYVTPPDQALVSIACPTQTTFCYDTTPDITVTNTSSTTTYRYLVDQTLAPNIAAVQAGTADADGTFTVPDGVIHPHATFYIHVIAQNLDGDFSTNYTTYKIISRDSSGSGGIGEMTTEIIPTSTAVDHTTITTLPQTGADLY